MRSEGEYKNSERKEGESLVKMGPKLYLSDADLIHQKKKEFGPEEIAKYKAGKTFEFDDVTWCRGHWAFCKKEHVEGERCPFLHAHDLSSKSCACMIRVQGTYCSVPFYAAGDGINKCKPLRDAEICNRTPCLNPRCTKIHMDKVASDLCPHQHPRGRCPFYMFNNVARSKNTPEINRQKCRYGNFCEFKRPCGEIVSFFDESGQYVGDDVYCCHRSHP